ncbi:hypothetical protein QTP88_014975 [Uroleucon formosanum]
MKIYELVTSPSRKFVPAKAHENSTDPKDINSRICDESLRRPRSAKLCQPAVVPGGDQTANPNRIMTPFVPFTPQTRTQQRPTTIGNRRSTKKWKCDNEVGNEPSTDQSDAIGTVWQDITLPT